MPFERPAAFEPVEATLVGFDVAGFSRFAEAWLALAGEASADELAQVWETSIAPQVDALLAAGYGVADVCGDGIVAFRTGPGGEDSGLLRGLETAFARSGHGMGLRTASTRGVVVFAEVDALGQRHRWATGEGVRTLHASLDSHRSPAGAGVRPTKRHRASDQLVGVWTREAAEIRQMATMFVRHPSEPWTWSGDGRLHQLVCTTALAVESHGGRLARVTHDDKGLLLRCEFVGQDRSELLGAAEAGLTILNEMGMPGLSLAMGAGRVYRGPVRVGPAYETTIHGATVNRAAKTAGRESGLVVLAPAGTPMAGAFASLGLTFDATLPGWRARGEAGRSIKLSPSADPTHLIGRDAALRELGQAFDASLEGPVVVTVEGAAGIGKTAMVRSFARHHRAQLLAAWSSCRPDGGARGPWADALQALVSVAFDDDDAARSEISAAFRDAGLARDDFGLLSGHGLNLFEPAPSLAALEPSDRRARMDLAFGAVVRAATARRPGLTIFLEDVHWLSSEGWRWFALALESARRSLWVLTTRVQVEAPPQARRQRIRLEGLSAQDAERLTLQLRPELAGPAGAVASVAELCGGSPLLIEQMARAWPSPGTPGFASFGRELVGDAGGSFDEVLQRVLDLRLDGLSPDGTQALRILSVEAQPVPAAALATEGVAQGQTLRLAAAGFAQLADDGSVAIGHTLIAHAVLQRIPPLLRMALHARAARRLAHSADPSTVAAQWTGAGAMGRAAHWHARAAGQAERTAMLHAAIACYDAALGAAGEAVATQRTALAWRARLAGAAFGVGDLGRALAEARRCVGARGPARVTPRGGGARQRALLVQSEIATFTADLPLAVGSLLQLRFIRMTSAEGLHGRQAAFWGYLLALLRAQRLATRALDAGGAHSDLDRYYAEASRGLIHNCFGRWAEAEQALATALNCAPAERLPHENEIAATLLALGRYLQGDAAGSLKLFDAILESGRQRENAMHEAWGLYGSAQALVVLGRPAEATQRLDRADPILTGHLDRQSQLICSGLRVSLARQGERADLCAAMEANLALSTSMPASNFGSFEGYAATPLAALEWLSEPDLDAAGRRRVERLAQRGLQALGQYATVFPIGRPRLRLCQGLRSLPRNRRAARSRIASGLALAEQMGMAGEARLAAGLLARHRLGGPS
ncbi:MAG TPA: AAA family ATPase [Caulobacteraceae bacterium]